MLVVLSDALGPSIEKESSPLSSSFPLRSRLNIVEIFIFVVCCLLFVGVKGREIDILFFFLFFLFDEEVLYLVYVCCFFVV